MAVEDKYVELKDVFWMSLGQAKYMENFIKSKKLTNLLELGLLILFLQVIRPQFRKI